MHFLNWLYLFLQFPQHLADGIPAPVFGRVDDDGLVPFMVQRFRLPERPCRAHVRPIETACVPLRA